MAGKSSFASDRVTTCIASPKLRAIVTSRPASSTRFLEAERRELPTLFQSQDIPVSDSSRL